MSRNRNALAFVALLAMLAFITVGCASATTYTVCHSGCDYSNIQAAINAAESGDTLEVHSGTYYENVDVTKQLILKGVDTGSGKPVIDAGGIGSAITLSADEITLEGFTITNSGSRFEAGIKVTSNNNAISGNNASNNNHNGIKICESGNNTITGNIVSNNGVDGIQLIGSSNNNITGNAATNNHYGLFFSGSCGNSLRDNQMSDNCNNFKVISDSYYHFINDIDTSNLVDGKPIYYLEGASGTVIDSSSNAGTVYCINCDSVTVKDQNLSNNGYGIFFYNTSNSSIQNNNISNNNDGLFLDNSCNNTITDNNAHNNEWYDIHLSSSCNNTITNNNVSNSMEGIFLVDSCNNIITSNNVSNNNGGGIHGIQLVDSSNNNITGNTVTNNHCGLYFYGSDSNSLRDNLMSGNYNNFKVISDSYYHFINDIDTSNLVDGKPIYYLEGASGTVIDSSSNAGTVYCINCDSVTVKDQNLSNNGYGIFFYNTSNSSIQNNNISNNNDGLFLDNSCNNKIYHNNFINNRGKVYLDGTSNIWSSPEKICYVYEGTTSENYMGNYWSDYTGSDGYRDGIGDTPYIISGDNSDRYPLMKPFENYLAPPGNPAVNQTMIFYASSSYDPDDRMTSYPINKILYPREKLESAQNGCPRI